MRSAKRAEKARARSAAKAARRLAAGGSAAPKPRRPPVPWWKARVSRLLKPLRDSRDAR
jgi:hypothetical protein